MQNEPEYDPRHHRLGHTHQVTRRLPLVRALVRSVAIAEPVEKANRIETSSSGNAINSPCLLHHRRISAIASTSGLAQEHVEIVPLMVSFLETFGAQRHTGRNAARATSVGHEIRCPDEAAGRLVVVRPNCETDLWLHK